MGSLKIRLSAALTAGILLSGLAFCTGADAEADTDLHGIWDTTLNLRAGFGFKDNVTMSRLEAQESAFFASEAELMLLRLPVDGHELMVLGMARDARYFEGDEVESEQMTIALAQYRYYMARGWKPGFSLRYVYLDQVFDASVTETNLGSIQVRGHSIRPAPLIRKAIPHAMFIELEPGVNRQWFAEPLDDYWEPGTKLTLGKTYGYKSEATVSYEYSRRLYDTREPFALDRQPIAGKNLEYDQHEAAARVRHYWDKARHWQSTSRFSVLVSQDNETGFFDYNRYQFSQQAAYQAGDWELRLQAKLTYYDFPHQTVSVGDASARHRLMLAFGARAQYQLHKRVRLFAEYEHEDAWSNVSLDEYTVNTISSGVDIEL